ncbi:MAG: hypothetical protein RLN85_20915, partial [Pseudomonadales bacterium]
KAIPFRTPPGIRMVRVESRTGLPARPGDQGVIWEAFKPGTIPASNENVIDGGYSGGGSAENSGGAVSGPGGIY